MSITDELREWAKTLIHWWYDPVKDEYTYTTGTMPPSIDAIRLDSNIIAIADRIDAEHEAMLVDARKTVYQGYIELPKDADNMPWSVGDRDEDGNVVIEPRRTSSGWFVVTDDMGPYRPERKRHYHAPTVEDVLTEFGIDWEHESDCEDRAALLKEYASKLRLAEGED